MRNIPTGLVLLSVLALSGCESMTQLMQSLDGTLCSLATGESAERSAQAVLAALPEGPDKTKAAAIMRLADDMAGLKCEAVRAYRQAATARKDRP